MNKAPEIVVHSTDAGQRLDRWFKRKFPMLTHGHLEKLLRTGQVRVDGSRARSGRRLVTGESIRVPPAVLAQEDLSRRKSNVFVSEQDKVALRQTVIYQDDDLLAINKPAGLAVQGGSKITRHLDGMLDALRFDSQERPKLVHRLDKDTSGVLLLARNAKAAALWTQMFRRRQVRKLYWAIVVGRPSLDVGEVTVPLAKVSGCRGEKVIANVREGKHALTRYRVIASLDNTAAWLALEPQTGRTHQLRVHCGLLGTPILGDGKYGGKKAFLPSLTHTNKVHLHGRALNIAIPEKKPISIVAPLPPHISDTIRFFGFEEGAAAAAHVLTSKTHTISG